MTVPIWAKAAILQGVGDDSSLSFPNLGDCQCFDVPFCLVESECGVGAVGVCSILAAFRGVSEGWETLVVIYSMSKVELKWDEGFEYQS